MKKMVPHRVAILIMAMIAAMSAITARAEQPGVSLLSAVTASDVSRVSRHTHRNVVQMDSAHGNHNGKVGLVLSGGGAKGIAHVGVIKALEDNDIPIDYVTGTSMGAIVGSLYSCGWTPERMMQLFTSKGFTYWSTGVIPSDRIYYYIQPTPTPKWLEVNLNFDSKDKVVNQILPTSLISPLPMNIEFLNLYGPYSEQCGENFNNLFVPFRCVTSDVYHKHKIVLSNGSLGDAVRASMSFPLVFRPIKIDGVLVYDGGIYDNFPVNVMRKDFNPDFIIGVSVSGRDSVPIRGDLYSQLEDMIIQNNDYRVPRKIGVKIQVPVLNFGVLQFDKAKEIYDIGYMTGLHMVDSIKKRMPMRRSLEEVTKRREAYALKTPALEFDSVAVTGVGGDQARYLRFLFRGQHGSKRIDMPEVINSYYRAVTDGTLSNLLPQAEFGRDGNNTLMLEATPKRPSSIGVGGWISSSTNSMLFLKAGYHSMRLNSLDVSLNGWIGQSYYAGLLDARFAFPSSRPSLVQLEASMSRQKFYDSEVLFYQTDSPAFITGDVNYLRGSYVWAANRKTKGWVSLAWGYMFDHYFPDANGSYADKKRDKLQYRLGVLRTGFEKNTLNDKLYPSSGIHWNFELRGAYELSRWCPESKVAGGFKDTWWGALWVYYKQFFEIDRDIQLGVMANGLITYRDLNQNYTATLVHSTEFGPTPSTQNYFNEEFRSDNYVAAGLIPMWTPLRNLQLRGDFYAYSKIRELKNMGLEVARYGGWFRKVQFVGEVAAVYNFPFASLSVYANYLSSPKNNWNFGINFGLFFQAPKLIH